VTTQPLHDRLDRTPTWLVQGVFDPDVKGQNFSHTIGLDERGLPELHLWASPTNGHDRCHILNELAFAMIDGRLSPAPLWSRSDVVPRAGSRWRCCTAARRSSDWYRCTECRRTC
jgi:hypothetical protein